MGFERWYLRQLFSKRKGLSVGLLLVILSVTLISASPTAAYFHMSNREANTARIQSDLVLVGMPRYLGPRNFSGLQELNGVQQFVPVVSDTVAVSVDGKNSSEYVYFVSTADAPRALAMFGFNQVTLPAQSGWLYFGFTEGSNDRVPVGRSVQVDVAGIGEMTGTTAATTFSDSDFDVFGDIQAYWASPSHTSSRGEYNALVVEATNSSVAVTLAETIQSTHVGWWTMTWSQESGAVASGLGSQLTFTLALGGVSWAFGIVVFGTYVVREVSSRSKELVTLRALGASRGELTRCLSYYLLLLTSLGGITGLFLCLGIVMPAAEVLGYGYQFVESASTTAYTSLAVFAPVLALDLVIVVFLQSRLGRLDMMGFLRSEV